MRILSVRILTNKESSIKQQVGIPAKLSNDHIHGSPVSLLRNRAVLCLEAGRWPGGWQLGGRRPPGAGARRRNVASD